MAFLTPFYLYAFRVALSWPLYENVTSSIKPETYNIICNALIGGRSHGHFSYYLVLLMKIFLVIVIVLVN